jgi:hypothetical protein
MNQTTLPSRKEITSFLRDYLTINQNALYLSVIVAALVEHFNVSEQDQQIMSNGNGTTGTLLECRTSYSLLDLALEGSVVLVGDNYWKASIGVRPVVKRITRREVSEAVPSLKILHRMGLDRDSAIITLLEKWTEPVLTRAANQVYC